MCPRIMYLNPSKMNSHSILKPQCLSLQDLTKINFIELIDCSDVMEITYLYDQSYRELKRVSKLTKEGISFWIKVNLCVEIACN